MSDVACGTLHEPAVFLDEGDHMGRHLLQMLGGCTVGGMVVLAAEQVVINSCHIRVSRVFFFRREIARLVYVGATHEEA